jgi:hypothetical protein
MMEWGERGVVHDTPDSHDDALRKAKCLAFPGGGTRPTYFSVVAVGVRFEFSVSYEISDPVVRFALVPDVIPVG